MAHRCPECSRICNCDRELKLPIVHVFLPAIDCVHHPIGSRKAESRGRA